MFYVPLRSQQKEILCMGLKSPVGVFYDQRDTYQYSKNASSSSWQQRAFISNKNPPVVAIVLSTALLNQGFYSELQQRTSKGCRLTMFSLQGQHEEAVEPTLHYRQTRFASADYITGSAVPAGNLVNVLHRSKYACRSSCNHSFIPCISKNVYISIVVLKKRTHKKQATIRYLS